MAAKLATNEGLETAVRALDAMAAGAAAARADVVSGALAMNTVLMRDPDASANRDLCDAKLELESLACILLTGRGRQGIEQVAETARLARGAGRPYRCRGNELNTADSSSRTPMPKKKKTTPDIKSPASQGDASLIRQLWLDGLSIDSLAEKFEKSPENIWTELEGERRESLDRKSLAFSCSFCNRSQTEVAILIAGHRATICEECLEISLAIVQETRPDLLHIHIGRSEDSNSSS